MSTDEIFGIKILIVDDQTSNLRLLEYTLRRGGHLAVTSTTNPVEVCALHLRNRYGLILLDLQMPRMNGFEVMKTLGDLEGKDAPAILVLTADPAQMVPALQAGAKGFLSKPFVLAEVLSQVRQILVANAVKSTSRHRKPLLATDPRSIRSDKELPLLDGG